MLVVVDDTQTSQAVADALSAYLPSVVQKLFYGLVALTSFRSSQHHKDSSLLQSAKP